MRAWSSPKAVPQLATAVSTLDDHGLGASPDGPARQIQAVEDMRLLVDRGLGGVDVFGWQPVVVKDPARPKTQDRTGGIPDGPQQPTYEEITAAIAYQSRCAQRGVVETLRAQGLSEGMPAPRGIAKHELLSHNPVEASPVEKFTRSHRLG